MLCGRLLRLFFLNTQQKLLINLQIPFDVGSFKFKISFVTTGWGKNDFTNNGNFQAIMKDVDVPLVETNSCQTQLRATRLGSNFVLDTASFMCAGGEAGKGKKLSLNSSIN